MYMFLVIPMVLFFTMESLLWKKNRKSPMQTLLGTTIWSLVTILIVFAFSFIWETDVFVNFSWAVFGFAAMQSALVVCNIMLWVGVMKCLPLSIAEPIALSRVVLLTIFSFLIFGGTLAWPAIACVSVIFVSCIAIGYLQGKYKKRDMDRNYGKGLLLVFLWVLTSVGINLITQHAFKPTKFGGLGVLPITYNVLQISLILLIAIVMFLIHKPKELVPTFKAALTNKVHIGIGATGVLARICFSFILSFMGLNVGILTAIQMAYVALVVIASYFIYKERINKFSYILIAIVIASAALLSLAPLF